jgi:uncharacterized protein YbjT (DUF2867 family)
MFKNKILLITGGTGSFGNAVLRNFLNTDIKEIRIFSRDELKQDDMRKKYNNDKLKFYLGDVRDVAPAILAAAATGGTGALLPAAETGLATYLVPGLQALAGKEAYDNRRRK